MNLLQLVGHFDYYLIAIAVSRSNDLFSIDWRNVFMNERKISKRRDDEVSSAASSVAFRLLLPCHLLQVIWMKSVGTSWAPLLLHNRYRCLWLLLDGSTKCVHENKKIFNMTRWRDVICCKLFGWNLLELVGGHYYYTIAITVYDYFWIDRRNVFMKNKIFKMTRWRDVNCCMLFGWNLWQLVGLLLCVHEKMKIFKMTGCDLLQVMRPSDYCLPVPAVSRSL